MLMFVAKVVNVPGMGDSITQGTIESYEKNIGDWVDLDEVVAMVETDKITVDIRSPEQGVLTKLFASTGDTVDVGAPFFEIDVDAAKPAAGSAPKVDAPKVDAPKSDSTPAPAKQEAPK